jgi:hypothetical protein
VCNCVEYISIYVRLCKGDYLGGSGVCSEMLVYVYFERSQPPETL